MDDAELEATGRVYLSKARVANVDLDVSCRNET